MFLTVDGVLAIILLDSDGQRIAVKYHEKQDVGGVWLWLSASFDVAMRCRRSRTFKRSRSSKRGCTKKRSK